MTIRNFTVLLLLVLLWATPSRAAFNSRKVAAGLHHTLFICDNGSVMAVGDNTYGQLGDGTNSNKNTPVTIPGLSQIVMVSAGDQHSMALDADGNVWAWGRNNYEQIAFDNFIITEFNTPQLVMQLVDVNIISISAGGDHCVVLDATGQVWTWGRNDHGQLANELFGIDQYEIPTVIPGLNDIKMITAGRDHSMALNANGAVYTWGRPDDGRLGTPCVVRCIYPKPVMGLPIIETISAGAEHSMAVDASGTVWAWGNNTFGQLGIGNTIDSDIPVALTGMGIVQFIEVGQYHCFAFTAGGNLFAWGENAFGQVGDGSNTTRTAPVPIGIIAPPHISAGGYHNIIADHVAGTVQVWGRNNFGQLGDGSSNNTNTPTTVSYPCNTSASCQRGSVKISYDQQSIIAAFDAAALTTPTARLWQFGDGNTQSGTTFNSVNHTYPRPGTYQVMITDDYTCEERQTHLYYSTGINQKTIAGGAEHSLILCNDGTVWSGGDNQYGQLGNNNTVTSIIPVPAQGLTDVVSVAAGAYHSLAVKEDGTLWAWGRNDFGQLGDGGTTDQLVPIPVPGLNNIILAAAGESHSLALDANGNVWSWGRNHLGQLGDGTIIDRSTPAIISGMGGAVTDIDATANHSAALVGSHYVKNWGGYFSSWFTSPHQLAYLDKEIRTIAVGEHHGMILMQDGSVWTFGSSQNNVLGDWLNVQLAMDTPVQAWWVDDIVAISAGIDNSYALDYEGNVYSWGWDDFGELGDVGLVPNRAIPQKILDIEGAQAIGAGHQHVMIAGKDGSVQGLGNNTSAQLGDATTNSSITPVSTVLNCPVASLGPIANAGDNHAICPGDTAMLGGLPTAAQGCSPYTFTWTPNQFISDTTIANPSAYPPVTTTYYLTVTDSNGLTDQDSVAVSVFNGNQVVADAGPDVTVCQGGSQQLGGAPTGLSCHGIETYLWNPPTGLNNPFIANPVMTGTGLSGLFTYVVLVTDSMGNVAIDTVFITVHPGNTPSINPPGPIDICDGDSTTLIADSAVAYSWYPNNDTTRSITVSAPGPYVVTTTDTNGCTNTSDTVWVNVLPSPSKPTITVTGDTTICTGAMTTLTSDPAANYFWQPGGHNTQSIDVTVSGCYTVTVVDGMCNSTSDPVCITVIPPPAVDAGPDLAVCEGNCTTINTNPNVDTTLTYFWLNGSTLNDTSLISPTACPVVTTSYRLAAIDTNGCYAEDTITVKVSTVNQVEAEYDTMICKGTCVPIEALYLQPEMTFSWSPTAMLDDSTSTMPIVCTDTTTVFVLSISDTIGCSASDTVTVTIIGTDTVFAGNDTTICPGTTLNLGQPAAAGLSYSWSPGFLFTDTTLAQQTITPTTDVDVVLTVDEQGLCLKRDTMEIRLDSNMVVTASNDTLICAGDTIQLFAAAPSANTYQWSPFTGLNDEFLQNPLSSPAVSTSYVVTASSGTGCSDTETVVVAVDTACMWPGDANYDGIANVVDILNIGIAYGSTGPPRADMSTGWYAHSAIPWGATFLGGTNYKHTDGDGNGLIDLLDVIPINDNYNMIHNKSAGSPDGPKMAPPIGLQFSSDTVFVNDTAHITIYLGTMQQTVTAYGFAFALQYDPALVDSGTLTLDFSNSWMAGPNDQVNLYKNFHDNGTLEVGFSRTDQVSQTGFGPVVDMIIVMEDNLDGKDTATKTLPFDFGMVIVIDANEDTVDVAPMNDTLIVAELTGIRGITRGQPLINVYPNPADQTVILSGRQQFIEAIEISNVLGQVVFRQTGLHDRQVRLSTPNYESGLYVLTIYTRSGQTTQRLVISH